MLGELIARSRNYHLQLSEIWLGTVGPVILAADASVCFAAPCVIVSFRFDQLSLGRLLLSRAGLRFTGFVFVFLFDSQCLKKPMCGPRVSVAIDRCRTLLCA